MPYMSDPAQIPIRSTTQAHLDIEDIDQDIIILKDGSCALVLTTTALNFGLLSEQEQDATIYAYGSLLNSLTFPIQLVINSHRKDVTSYLSLLDKAYAQQHAPLLKDLMKKYREFIQETVKEQNVLDKKFYIVIPFSSLELGIKSAVSTMPSVLPGRKKKAGLPFPKDFIVQKALTALTPKKVHLIRLLARLGLKARQLTTQELIQLFFEIYNPNTTGIRLAPGPEYETPIVQGHIQPAKPSTNPPVSAVPATSPSFTPIPVAEVSEPESNMPPPLATTHP
jgi:hypothetical protein